MTLAIAHRDAATNRVVLDAVTERRPPFSPDQVAKDFCDLLRSYRVRKVTGDRYGGEWPRERFRVHGIQYELADKPKSDLYGALLPLLNAGRAELLDLPSAWPRNWSASSGAPRAAAATASTTPPVGTTTRQQRAPAR